MYYRTYRPQTIAELDIAHVRETLGAALLENKWSHAYLLIGNRGTGKTSTARLIAKMVNCPKRKKGEEPCNACPSCVAVTNGSSLDVIEIDAASNTGVDDIRDLREKVKLAPVSSPYKVYIIDEVHMLSTSAFNALLKTLEEPPEHVIFVLATTDPQKLPPTIVSRCMVFDFGSPKEDELFRAIERVVRAEKLKLEDGVVAAVAKKAQGSLRDAHKILEQLSQKEGTITLSDIESLSAVENALGSELLLAIMQKNRGEAFLLIEQYANQGKKIKDLYVNILAELRTLLLSSNGASTSYKEAVITRSDLLLLIEGLVTSYSQTWQSPIPQLPLEIALDSYFLGEQKSLGRDPSLAFAPTAAAKAPLSSSVVAPSVVSESSPPAVPPSMPTPVSPPSVPKEGKEESREETSPAPHHQAESGPIDPSVEVVLAKWPEIMAAVKAQNHNLVALLRAAKPKSLDGSKLTLEVLYTFHRDQLSEEKNRAVFETVVSAILATEIKSKFELVAKS